MAKMAGTFTITVTETGQVNVNVEHLPLDKVMLYGLLEVGKEAVSQIIAQSKAKIQMPPAGRILDFNGA